MAFTVYQYQSVTARGEPVEPAAARATARPLDVAFKLAASTVYVAVVPDADMHLRISDDGALATVADHRCEAGVSYGFPISLGATPSLYGTAAS